MIKFSKNVVKVMQFKIFYKNKKKEEKLIKNLKYIHLSVDNELIGIIPNKK